MIRHWFTTVMLPQSPNSLIHDLISHPQWSFLPRLICMTQTISLDVTEYSGDLMICFYCVVSFMIPTNQSFQVTFRTIYSSFFKWKTGIAFRILLEAFSQWKKKAWNFENPVSHMFDLQCGTIPLMPLYASHIRIYTVLWGNNIFTHSNFKSASILRNLSILFQLQKHLNLERY